jgi:hypothetical protein
MITIYLTQKLLDVALLHINPETCSKYVKIPIYLHEKAIQTTIDECIKLA